MKAFAIDMDGTVYHGGRPIPGATDFIAWLRSSGVPFRFLTNNSSHGRRFYAERLCGMGLQAEEREILTSATATARYLTSERAGEKVFPVCVPDVVAELEAAGVEISYDDPDIVLLGFDTTADYGRINRAYRLLMGGCSFVATHPDDLCPAEDGYDIDIGPFIRMFTEMCGKDAVVIGKPSQRMLEMAALDMGVRPEDVIMVGDRLYTDIRMACDAGTESIAVLTGEATPESIEASPYRPTYVCQSVADIPHLGIDLR